MASTVAVWTEHDQKTISTQDTPCTMIMYRTLTNKYITGLYFPSMLLKSGSDFPSWNNSSGYQVEGNGFLAGPSNLTNWTVKNTLRNETPDPTTNRLLLAGTTSQKITNSGIYSTTNYKNTFANFVNTTFSIGPGIQVANITGGLHSSIATDKLAEMTPNDWSTFVSSNLYDSTLLNNYKEENVPFVKSWSGTQPDKPNTYYVHKDVGGTNAGGLRFNTETWGTESGIDLIDIAMFDGTKCVGVNTNGSVQDLNTIEWNHSGGKSIFLPGSSGGETADLYMACGGGTSGYTPGHSASCYIRLNNADLYNVNTNPNIVSGNYILKANLSANLPANYSFIDGNATLDRSFSLNNMALTWQGSNQSPGTFANGDEDRGAKVKLQWKVSSGLNDVYHQDDATNLSSTSSDKVIFTENIRRLRTDGNSSGGNLSQDVLFMGNGESNSISILPEKVWTTDSWHERYDTYGLWFNATYTYYINAFNVITGDIITNKLFSVKTQPGTPINWKVAPAADATTNPSIQLEWQTPPATGSASSISYTFQRQAYSVSGTDVSDNSTQMSKTYSSVGNHTATPTTSLIGGINIPTGGTGNIENLLYGKYFSCTLKATTNSSSNTIPQTFTVPESSGSNTAFSYDLDASQNGIANIIQTQSFDSNPYTLTYEDNFIVITVPTDYTFTDGTSPTEYQIFEQYNLITTIPHAKILPDASGNNIILSKYWANGSKTNMGTEIGIYLNVIAADPVNGQYSPVGTTKYIQTLPIALAPAPKQVTNMTVTGNFLLNKITISWDYPLGSIDKANDPSNYNWIKKVHIYAITNPNAQTTGHYEQETGDTYAFTESMTLSNITTYTMNNNETNHNSYKSYTYTNRYDNEIIGFRILTENSQGVLSGYSPDGNNEGLSLLYGTTQDGGNDDGTGYSDMVYDGTFTNTHIQGKTSVPVKAGQVSMGGGSGSNNINPTWVASGSYSTDTPRAYSVFYVYNSTLGSADTLTPSNSVIEGVPTVDATSTNTFTSTNITGLVPGSTYTASVIVYTNMQATHADSNIWTPNDSGAKTKPYSTSQNTVNVANYSITATDDSVSSGFKIPVELGEPVYQQDFDSNNLTWKHPEYNAYTWALSGGVTRTTPKHMIAQNRFIGQSPGSPTKMTLDPTGDDSVISDYTMVEGDIIAVFDVANNYCLDNYTWSETGSDSSKVLLCDKNLTGTGGFMFQLWKGGGVDAKKTLHNLYVTSYTRHNIGSDPFNDTDQLDKITGGATATVFIDLKFAMTDSKYKIYHNGVYKTTVTNALTYDITSNADTTGDVSNNNYDITWYSEKQTGHNALSNVTSWSSNANYESRKWTATSDTGFIVEQPTVISIGNPVKSYVQYTSDSTDITLGNAGSQSFTFTHGGWNKISFNVVDTDKTSLHSIIESITGLLSTDAILIYDWMWDSYVYENGAWSGTADIEINYDQGYAIFLTTQDGRNNGLENATDTTRTLNISGATIKAIRGINLTLVQGWNFMGHPYQENKEGTDVLSNTDINSDSDLWSQLYIAYAPTGASLKGPYYSTRYGGSNTMNNTYPHAGEVMSFKTGEYYYTEVESALILLIGSLTAIRNKADFDGNNIINNEDAIALANYIVTINPDYASIASAITSEAASNNYFANIKSTDNTPVGLNDLVYLISHVASPETYPLS